MQAIGMKRECQITSVPKFISKEIWKFFWSGSCGQRASLVEQRFILLTQQNFKAQA